MVKKRSGQKKNTTVFWVRIKYEPLMIIQDNKVIQIMRIRRQRQGQFNNQQEREEIGSQEGKVNLRRSIKSKRKLNLNHKVQEYPRNSSFSSSSLATSYMKINSLSQSDLPLPRHFDSSALTIAHFTQKYLPRGAPKQQIFDQMKMVIERKDNEIQALRIYRDQLKFISFNNPYYTPIRLSLRSLRGKATVERQINNQKEKLQKDIFDVEIQTQAIFEYTEMISQKMKQSVGEVLDMEKEEFLMIQNLEMETAHIIKELSEEKRRNAKEIRQIQDEILDLRVIIKQKEDKLRDLKAKICTMYIKLHSRNNSRGSKSKQRNMSLSVRKFNSQHHQTIRQAFVGNNSFKNYSRQIIEKVSPDDELTRIRFFFRNKQNLIFQCLYKNTEGQLHTSSSTNQRNSDNQITKDKISEENETMDEIYTKHLFSMKFFYKSKIVGVECRIKTQKGTKTLQLGNCDPHIEHELLTLVNKQMVTLGSYWHGKQMIGISVWYSDRPYGDCINSTKIKSSRKTENKRPKQTYEEYYT